jgi:hypothetical protein
VTGVVALISAGVTAPRNLYYHVAWREFLAHPLLGSGAGTFGHYWLRWGDVGRWGGALDAHSLYLETLAELGPIGLVLLGAFLLYPLRRTIAQRSLPFVPAAAGATIAFLVHVGLDWDWEMPAVVVAGLGCAAAVAFAEPEKDDGEPAPTLPTAVRAAAVAAALLAGAAAIAGARSTTEPRFETTFAKRRAVTSYGPSHERRSSSSWAQSSCCASSASASRFRCRRRDDRHAADVRRPPSRTR